MPPQVGGPGRLAAAARCAHGRQQSQAQHRHQQRSATVAASARRSTSQQQHHNHQGCISAHATPSIEATEAELAAAAIAPAGTFPPATARRGTWRTSFRRGFTANCCNVNRFSLNATVQSATTTITPISGTTALTDLKLSKRTHQPFRALSYVLRRYQPCLPQYSSSPAGVAAFSTSAVPLRSRSRSIPSQEQSTPLKLRLIPLRPRCGACLIAMTSQKREHGGHSHGPGHHHHHDNSYLISANKNDPGVRITRIGLLSNLGMAVAKFVGGYAFNSRAMTADAWHSIADLASDILTLATVSFSLKPPTERFPMGFGKVESLGSLGVSGMLLFGGLYMGWESALSLYGHFYPEMAHEIMHHVGHGHGHSHSHGYSNLDIPSMHAAWLAGGTILIKEWLYRASKSTKTDHVPHS